MIKDLEEKLFGQSRAFLGLKLPMAKAISEVELCVGDEQIGPPAYRPKS